MTTLQTKRSSGISSCVNECQSTHGVALADSNKVWEFGSTAQVLTGKSTVKAVCHKEKWVSPAGSMRCPRCNKDASHQNHQQLLRRSGAGCIPGREEKWRHDGTHGHHNNREMSTLVLVGHDDAESLATQEENDQEEGSRMASKQVAE
jgi:hypothetical protein